MTTLSDFLNKLEKDASVKLENNKSRQLTATIDVIKTITEAGKQISSLLKKGALADIHGEAGAENVQGEQQKKLDIIANDILLEALTDNNNCAGVASEELEDATPANPNGTLLALFDPLDGSSNIDINMPTGTIFSILPFDNHLNEHSNTSNKVQNSDFLQEGTQQLAAGYLLYGSSTLLTFSFAQSLDTNQQGVVMFSLNPDNNQFELIKTNITIAADTNEYAINASNYRHWLPPIQTYINDVIAGESGVRNKNFNTRWVAAMVGDVHRILCRGGIFLYPNDTKDPNKPGKLRLMYEANPMSLLIEQAGGAATDGHKRIMEYVPNSIHQRVPVVLGSKNEVLEVSKYHQC